MLLPSTENSYYTIAKIMVVLEVRNEVDRWALPPFVVSLSAFPFSTSQFLIQNTHALCESHISLSSKDYANGSHFSLFQYFLSFPWYLNSCVNLAQHFWPRNLGVLWLMIASGVCGDDNFNFDDDKFNFDDHNFNFVTIKHPFCVFHFSVCVCVCVFPRKCWGLLCFYVGFCLSNCWALTNWQTILHFRAIFVLDFDFWLCFVGWILDGVVVVL